MGVHPDSRENPAAALSADVMLRIAETDLSQAFRSGLAGDPNITETQFWRFFYAASAIMRTTENAFNQYEDDLVTGAHLESAKASARTFLTSPGYRALWQTTRLGREPRFRAFMDELAAEAATARAVDVFARWRSNIEDAKLTGV